ncbi:hypothetical protein GCM10027090_13150 [Sinomonas soli]
MEARVVPGRLRERQAAERERADVRDGGVRSQREIRRGPVSALDPPILEKCRMRHIASVSFG